MKSESAVTSQQTSVDQPDALISLVIAIDRYNDYEIGIVEARRLIMPIFGLPVDDCAHLCLVDYLDTLLEQLRGGDLSPGTVLNDLTMRASLPPAVDGGITPRAR